MLNIFLKNSQNFLEKIKSEHIQLSNLISIISVGLSKNAPKWQVTYVLLFG
jgi:hypothetical protein